MTSPLDQLAQFHCTKCNETATKRWIGASKCKNCEARYQRPFWTSMMQFVSCFLIGGSIQILIIAMLSAPTMSTRQLIVYAIGCAFLALGLFIFIKARAVPRFWMTMDEWHEQASKGPFKA